jgi:hypothetical protein
MDRSLICPRSTQNGDNLVKPEFLIASIYTTQLIAGHLISPCGQNTRKLLRYKRDMMVEI